MFRTCPQTERANPQGWAPGPGLGRLMRRTSMAPSTGTGDTFIVFWCWRCYLHWCWHVCWPGTCPPCSRLGCPRWRSSTTRWPPPGWRCMPTRTSASPGQNSEDLSDSVSLLSASVSSCQLAKACSMSLLILLRGISLELCTSPFTFNFYIVYL